MLFAPPPRSSPIIYIYLYIYNTTKQFIFQYINKTMCAIYFNRESLCRFNYHHARMIYYNGCKKISKENLREPDIIAINEARNVPRDMTGDIIAIDEAWASVVCRRKLFSREKDLQLYSRQIWAHLSNNKIYIYIYIEI